MLLNRQIHKNIVLPPLSCGRRSGRQKVRPKKLFTSIRITGHDALSFRELVRAKKIAWQARNKRTKDMNSLSLVTARRSLSLATNCSYDDTDSMPRQCRPVGTNWLVPCMHFSTRRARTTRWWRTTAQATPRRLRRPKRACVGRFRHFGRVPTAGGTKRPSAHGTGQLGACFLKHTGELRRRFELTGASMPKRFMQICRFWQDILRLMSNCIMTNISRFSSLRR